MPTTYRYRLLKGASWGIAITLQGDSALGESPPQGAAQITDRTWLQLNVGWKPSGEEMQFVRLGLRVVAQHIENARPGKAPIVIRLTGMEYNPCDYQPEGLAAATAEWAAQEFGFSKPDIPVTFDRTRRRYIYTFPQAAQERLDWPVRESWIVAYEPVGLPGYTRVFSKKVVEFAPRIAEPRAITPSDRARPADAQAIASAPKNSVVVWEANGVKATAPTPTQERPVGAIEYRAA